MLQNIAKKLFGSANARIVKSYQKTVDQINGFEEGLQKLSNAQLKAKTDEFKAAYKDGKSLDALLPEAFAVVREASVRCMNMRHFDVQMIGGIVQHRGMISEMKTGEGKTLVATLAAYLNAIGGDGVHIVTVNDYLAKRDSEWMGKLFEFLGLSVSCIVNDMEQEERAQAYKCDIVYATNNELGFDYLRDNMKFLLEGMVQRKHNFAIIDEVDSILIDEARTPLIISGPTEDNSDLYVKINKIVPQLKDVHFEIEEKSKSTSLTDEGVEFVEELLQKSGEIDKGETLYDINNVSLVHHVNQALRAHKNFTLDVDYLVQENRVIIIDEFTGRMMEGRRFSDGLHQALEAKEGVEIQNENQTLASITFQNYFRMYKKLAGMTGTAMTEAQEFADIYGLDVVEIPTNVPVARDDKNDEIYRTAEQKFAAVIREINEAQKKSQPVLVGTASIETSEYLSKLLKKEKIKHEVLNAKQHEREAYIIAQAGRPGAVTIATNMAGRGTDIKLGGNADMRVAEELGAKADDIKIKKIEQEVEADKQKVLDAGGLYVIGTERHESRRIDNQLRGRSGRQGDPGASKFYLSLEDDLLRIFGSERIDPIMQRLGLDGDEAIYHPWMNKAIERAQKKVEGRNYEVRKNLLKFDDVMNDQRKVIYDQRIEIISTDDVSETITGMIQDVNEDLVDVHIPKKSYHEQWDVEGLDQAINRTYGLDLDVKKMAAEEGIADEEILDRLDKATDALFENKEKEFTPEIMRHAEKRVLLQTLDQMWKDHLLSLDHLRGGIYLRAYGQKDPLNEYKKESFAMFESMLQNLREETVARMAHLQIAVRDEDEIARMEEMAKAQQMFESRVDPASQGSSAGEQPVQGQVKFKQVVNHVKPEDRDPNDPSTWGKVARNELCPCGSGKKYKHCHGKLA